jgi:predicted nucleic acid-binding protein
MSNSHWYVDASVGVRILLGGDGARGWFDTQALAGSFFVSSRILEVEIARALLRLGLDAEMCQWLTSRLALYDVTAEVLSRARSLRPYIKTLDAIHLATALTIAPAPCLVTHDKMMLTVAELNGLETQDPV